MAYENNIEHMDVTYENNIEHMDVTYENNITQMEEFDPNTYESDDEYITAEMLGFDECFTTTDANGKPIKKLTKEEIKALRTKSELAKQASQA